MLTVGVKEGLWFSHWAAVVLLTLYLLWNYFRYFSHQHFFDTDSIHRATRHQSRLTLFLLIITVVAFIFCCARYTISSIDNVVSSSRISWRFIGFILLPFVTNVQRYFNTYSVVYYETDPEDQSYSAIDIAISLTLTAGVEVGLCDLPLLVVFGWWVGQPVSIMSEQC